MIIYDPKITGSFQVNGSTVTSIGEVDTISGSVASLNAATSSYALSSSISGSFTSISQSFASERLKNTTDTLTGDLTVTGTITAQEFHTEYVSGSIIYSSGSSKFGDSIDDNHEFTGSAYLGRTYFRDQVDISSTYSLNFGSSRIHSTDTSYFLGGNVGVGTNSPDYRLEVESTSDADLVSIKSTADANNTQMRLGISGSHSVISGTGGSSGNLVFKTYGSERMRIDSSGRVGIGVTPSDWSFTALQIKNSSLWSSGGDLGINANSYFDGSNYRYVGSSSASSRVYFNTDGSITFYQAPTGTAGDVVSFTERMSLNSGGNLKVNNRLLVNTTITDGQLNVEGTQPFLFKNSYGSLLYRDVSTTGIELHVRADQSKNTFVSFTENAVADKWVIKTLASDNSLYFSTGNPSSNTNRVTFDSSGNVSLSTGDLFINSGTSYNDKGYIYLSNQRTAIISDIVNLTANGDTSLDFQTRSGGSTASAMFINEFRKVGINNTDPTAQLDISSGATNIGAAIRSTDAGAFIGFADNTTTLDAGYPTTSIGAIGNDMILSTANAEAMRIDSTGRLNLNYNNSTIHTYGSNAFGATAVIKANSTTPNAALALLNGNVGGDNPVWINFINEFVTNQYNYIARIGAEPTQTWTGTASTRDSNLTFYTTQDGVTTEKARILSSGGITFNGDTAAANALDDYEEGTFTPVLNNAGSPSYSRQYGQYTKIGNLVFVTIKIEASNITSSGNTLSFSLPFTANSASDTSQRSSGIVEGDWVNMGLYVDTLRFRVAGAATQAVRDNSGSSVYFAYNNLGSTTIEFNTSLTYLT